MELKVNFRSVVRAIVDGDLDCETLTTKVQMKWPQNSIQHNAKVISASIDEERYPKGGYNESMRFMACIAAFTAVIPLSGCASADIHLRSGSSSSAAPSAPPGTSYSTAVFRADVSPGGYFALLLFGHFMAGFEGDYRDGGYGMSARKAPEMAEDRNIVEMDCSQPMARPSGNLRCK